MIPDTEPTLVDAFLTPARELLAALLLTAVNVTLVLHVRTASRIRALTIAPVIVTSVASNALVIAFLVARNVAPDGHAAQDLGVAWALSLPAIAVAFVVGLVQRRLVIANVLSGIALALRASLTTRQVGAGLRSAIGDPAVEVLARDPDSDTWIHENGTVAAPADLEAHGSVVRTVGREEPVAALVLGGDIGTDDELVDAIVSLTETALREVFLLARLEASLHELDESRKRIATAADVERRRIERDLHDGAQQRLIALRMRLSLAEDLLRENPGRATKAIRDLGEDIDHALEEIRAVAHGVYPALLADRGLVDALAGVARRLPLSVTVGAEGLTRQTAEVESAVYFSCVEALQNVVKHASAATGARVVLHQNDVLTFEVADDGEGFDPRTARAGHGLENMHDRVESLGGTLTILGAPGKGTVIRGAVPLRARDDSGQHSRTVRTHGAARGRHRLAP
jgi:signal transduction histidine kinase